DRASARGRRRASGRSDGRPRPHSGRARGRGAPPRGRRRAALLRNRIGSRPSRSRSRARWRRRGGAMIVSRAPVRFSLGGGGTDLPAYSERFGGYLVSAAIDKYIYVTANKRFYPDIRLAYSKTEIVKSVDAIEHPIFREALSMLRIEHSI